LFFKFIRKNLFFLFFILFFIISNTVFAKMDYVNKSPMFVPNDYAKTLYEYGTNRFSTAILGNSTAIAALRNDLLGKDCGNASISYGTIKDFEEILRRGFIVSDKEVIICANYLAFLDNWETNESYPWLREPYAPYVYYYRSATADYLKENIINYFKGDNTFFEPVADYYFDKTITPGHMTDSELEERKISFEERFGDKTIEDFKGNIKALEKIISYCNKKDLTLRFVWMPINPKYDNRPAYIKELSEKVNGILTENNIDYIDWTDAFEAKYFYDLGHISWEEGSLVFTQEFIKWLKK